MIRNTMMMMMMMMAMMLLLMANADDNATHIVMGGPLANVEICHLIKVPTCPITLATP